MIAVTGGRTFNDDGFLNRTLTDLDTLLSLELLILGECSSGADQHAKRWALAHRKDLILVPANWGGRGRPAGPYRNRLMLTILKALSPRPLLVAFPGGAGTADCIGYAELAGIEVRRVAPIPKPAPTAPDPLAQP